MSGVQKAPGLELKPPDKGEQPMDLAPRTSHVSKTAQQVMTIGTTLRPHLDATKSAFTLPFFQTLGQRLPCSPILQGTTTSTAGIPTVCVTSSYAVKSGPGPAVSQLSTLRHMVSSSSMASSVPLSSVVSSTCSSPMASVMRGSSATQMGQPVPHQFSSHVPRGPAAVASINTAPKSALATPILRSSIGQVTATSHIPVGARSSNLAPSRASFTSLPRPATLSMTQVMDLQKTSSHGGGQVQVGMPSTRTLEARTTLGHSSVGIAKPLHVTQPVVHSIHQVMDKAYKCSPAGVQYTALPGLSVGSHPPTVVSTTSPLTTSCGATTVSTHPQVVQQSGAAVRSTSLGSMSLVTLAPTMAAQSTPRVVPGSQTQQQGPMGGPLVGGSCGGPGMQPIFTVVPSKAPLASPVPAPASHLPSGLVMGQGRLVTGASIPHVTSSVTTTTTLQQTMSIQVAAATSRPITTTVSIQPPSTAMPAGKVFGQQGSTVSGGLDGPPASDTSLTGTLFVGQPSTRNMVSSASLPATVVISDSRPDRSAQLPGAASYATYLYEPYPIQGASIAMHPYASSGSPVTPVFPATSLRSTRPQLNSSGVLGVASSTSMTVGQPLQQQVQQTQPMQQAQLSGLGATTVRAPLMVAVDSGSRQPPHVTLHTPFTPSVSTGMVGHGPSVTEAMVTAQGPSGVTPTFSYMTPSNLLSPTHSTTPPNHNTSPRPSILRKRTFEGVSVKKNLMASLPGSEPASPRSEPPASISTTSSPKPASELHQESSNSSSTASEPVMTEGAKPLVPLVTIKQEPLEGCDPPGPPANGNATNVPVSSSSAVEASPRKKPRKQLLCANELLDAHSTDGDDDMEKEGGRERDLRKEMTRASMEDMKCVAFCKRPSMSLLTSYSQSWKTRQNHFARHTDVKPKDDKKQTVNDLANQKGVLQKANGWKVFHLTSQMEQVFFLEDTVHNKLSQLLDFIENKPPAIQTKPLNMDEERILSKINDLIKGNLQRSKIVQDQVTEAKQQVLKVLEHKPRIVEIIGKYVSKRPLKKREKM